MDVTITITKLVYYQNIDEEISTQVTYRVENMSLDFPPSGFLEIEGRMVDPATIRQVTIEHARKRIIVSLQEQEEQHTIALLVGIPFTTRIVV